MNIELTAVDPDENWEFFDDETPVPASDVEEIWSLPVDSAILVWRTLVSSNPREFVLPQLPSHHWSRQILAVGPDWYEYANNNELPDQVSAYLRRNLLWTENEQVLFVHSSHYAVATKFGLFLRNWRAFVTKNDNPVLLNLSHADFILFGDGGLLATGRRPREGMSP